MTDLTDLQLLAELRSLIEAGAARLEIDAGKLDHIDSPVGVSAESTRWFALLAAAIGAAAWFGGWIAAGLALAASVASWFGLVRPDVRRRIEARVRTVALFDVQMWRQLWRFGGVRLVAAGATCVAPDGNWMQFVRDRRRAA
jgi:hypothetical protein